MDAAVASAVAAHGLEEVAAVAFLAATRAQHAVEEAQQRLAKAQRRVAEEAPSLDGGGGATATAAAGEGGGLPALPFDALALGEIERRGDYLPAPQLPTAVAAVYASLLNAPDAELRLQAEYEEAIKRREEAELERDLMLKRVVPLRRFVPNESTEELVRQLRTETARRQQLDAEFRAIKGRIEEVADRIGRMQSAVEAGSADPTAANPAMGGALKPVHYRWMAGSQPVIPPGASMLATVDEIGRTAAALHQKLSVGGAAGAVEQEV